MEIDISEFHALQKQISDLQDCCSEWEKQALDYKAELTKTKLALKIAVDALKHYCTDSNNWSCVIDFTGDYDNAPSEFADKAIDQIKQITETKGIDR